MSEVLPFCSDMSVLNQSLAVGTHTLKNRLVIQPMEGCDGTLDGTPDELTIRRYRRFAESGAGLIWFEAVAIVHDGRASPRQLYINENNVNAYTRLLTEIREISLKETGINPLIIMQATHSGRYSKPTPVIARNNPLFEGETPLPKECIIADDELKALEERFLIAAKLAHKAGFDGVDIKSCHGYLLSELLASHTRSGLYGGSFDNRTRLMRNAIEAVRSNLPDAFIVTSRMNIYDAYAYPFGFGAAEGGGTQPDLTEPIRLLEILNLPIINITMGNPYQNPRVNRPCDTEAVERMCSLTRQIQTAFPSMAVVASGVSFLRERSGELVAGYIESDVCRLVGFGRMAFAYPHFARDILSGNFNKKMTCVTCGNCSRLMRAGQPSGCAVRDEPYRKLFREHCKS